LEMPSQFARGAGFSAGELMQDRPARAIAKGSIGSVQLFARIHSHMTIYRGRAECRDSGAKEVIGYRLDTSSACRH
jgi:hypothetical protein